MRMPARRGSVKWLVPLALLLLASAGCQTTGLDPTGIVASGQLDRAPEDADYGLLFTPADHIDALLQRGRLDDASAVYAHAADYLEGRDGGRFRRGPGDSAERLEVALKADLWPEAHAAWDQLQALSWPASPADWPARRAALTNAEVVLADIDSHAVLQAPGREMVFAGRLRAEAGVRRARLTAAARDAFQAYDLAGGNFFADYPVKLDGRAFLAANQDVLIAGLEEREAAAIAGIYRTYAHHMPKGLAAQVARRHYQAVLQARGGDSVLASLEALEATRAAGMPDGDWRAQSIAVFDVSLAPPARAGGGGGGAGAFPVSVRAPAPITVRLLGLRDSLLTAAAREAPYLVYVDVIDTRVSRQVVARETVSSQFRSGTREEPNPAYASLRQALDEAEGNVDQFSGGMPSLGNSCNIGAWECLGIEAALLVGTIVAEGIARRRVDTLRSQLSDTPMSFDEPVFEAYAFEKLKVELRRQAKVRLHVLDRLRQRYGTMTASVGEAMTFETVSGLHDDDRYRHRPDRRFDSAADIAAFAAQPLELSMARVMLGGADLTLVDDGDPDVEAIAAAIERSRDEAGVLVEAAASDPDSGAADQQRPGRATANRRKR